MGHLSGGELPPGREPGLPLLGTDPEIIQRDNGGEVQGDLTEWMRAHEIRGINTLSYRDVQFDTSKLNVTVLPEVEPVQEEVECDRPATAPVRRAQLLFCLWITPQSDLDERFNCPAISSISSFALPLVHPPSRTAPVDTNTGTRAGDCYKRKSTSYATSPGTTTTSTACNPTQSKTRG